MTLYKRGGLWKNIPWSTMKYKHFKMTFFSRQLKRCSTVKMVIILFFILIMQLIHMFMLSMSEYGQKKDNQVLPKTAIEILSWDILKKMNKAHISDSSGTYNIINDLIPLPYVNTPNQDVTLVTQGSSNHLQELILLSERWTGPISITVFTHPADLHFAVLRIAYIWTCFPHVKPHVHLNLVYPIYKLENLSEVYHKHIGKKIQCGDQFTYISKGSENYATSNVPYPHNLLRNTAIKAAETTFIFVVDIDMVPSVRLGEDFTDFIGKVVHHNPKFDLNSNAFVVPSFEIKTSQSIPSTKVELLQHLESDVVRPFYSEVCWRCQKFTEYDVWKDLPKVTSMEEAYEVDWRDPWEPFFITTRNQPLYDERFKQYGFNRISQVSIIYRFQVLIVNNFK